jgi:opacity protein-like surface antigen
MKKILAFLAVGLLSTAAVADGAKNFAHLQYTFRDTISDNQSDPNRQGVNFTLGRKITDSIQLDVNNQFRTEKLNSDSGSSSNRLEAGATYQFGITSNVSLYTRGAVGEKFTDLNNYPYYSVEPGIKAQLTNNWATRVGYRYRDAFSDSHIEKTNTLRLGAEYAIDKDQAITLGLDRSYGASDFVGYNVGYAVKF